MNLFVVDVVGGGEDSLKVVHVRDVALGCGALVKEVGEALVELINVVEVLVEFGRIQWPLGVQLVQQLCCRQYQIDVCVQADA